MVNNGKLSARQRRMITALLSSKNIGEACAMAGVGRSTLARWLGDVTFTTALAQSESEAMNEASRQLVAGKDDALDTLRSLAKSATSENVRRQAANDWLTHLFKIRELVDLENRVSELEKAVRK